MDKLDKFLKNVSADHKPHHHPSKRYSNKPNRQHKNTRNGDVLRVYPLGGFEEVGKNMTVFETKNDIIIIDMGLQFPEENMFGVDYVIPDISCLEPKKSKIRAILITHGHLDHIGAIPHLIAKLGFPPIYATPLTNGLIAKRLDEFRLTQKTKLKNISPSDTLTLGKDFKAGFFRINHSIPDGVGIVLDTPAGKIVHTGDFKFDFTPADDRPADFAKIATLGNQNILALFADSTNATEPGYTISESVIEGELDQVIEKATGRVIIATFSTLIGRIDQIIHSSQKHGRKVFLSGRSMENNIEIASSLGYIHAPRGSLRKLDHLRSIPDNQVTIITTGSQGEEMSALTRIALGTHAKIKIKPGDTVVLSATPISGNEKAIVTVINNLVRLGANVVTNRHLDVHTSGHAKQEDLKLMLSLVRPKFLVPVHGEIHMRAAHKELAMQAFKMQDKDIALIDNGDILEFFDGRMRKSKSKMPANDIMVDGRGIGDTASLVQTERQTMSQSGIVMLLFRVTQSGKLIADPNILSKGFVYSKEGKSILEEITQTAKKAYTEEQAKQKNFDEKARQSIRQNIERTTQRLIRKRLDREPLIVPMVVRT